MSEEPTVSAIDLVEAVVGGGLLFVVPGFALSRALFPEWRFRGPGGARRVLETATLSFVLSVALTVLVGSLLLGVNPGGFSAAWGDPVLEAALAGVAAVALVYGVLKGAYSRLAPGSAEVRGEPGGSGAWELSRTLDRLLREERRLAARLAADPPPGPGEEVTLREELAEIRSRRAVLERDREEAYAR